MSNLSAPRIHHATLARAASHGVVLMPVKGGFRAVHTASSLSVSGTDPKLVLADLLSRLAAVFSAPSATPSATVVASSSKAARKSTKKLVAKSSPASSDEETSPKPLSKSVVKMEYKRKYAEVGTGTTNGSRLSVVLSDALLGDGQALPKVAKENNIPFVWVHLNIGFQRMNLRNVIAAKVRRGEKATVFGVEVTRDML